MQSITQLTKLFSYCMATPTPDNSSNKSGHSSLEDLKAHLNSAPEIRILTLAEYKPAALALAEAFANDDVSRYFIDTPDRANWDEKRKWNLHLKIMEGVVFAHILKGVATSVGDDYGCIALWMPPNANCDDLFTTIRSGLWKLKYQLCREGRARFFAEFYPLLHDTKASVLGDRNDTSWYLVYIGTRPAARGNGYARKSIEYVTKLADENGEPCYLESSNAINPAIYAKMGFKIKEKIELKRAESRVELDIMVREPGLETCSIGVGGGGKDMIETPN